MNNRLPGIFFIAKTRHDSRVVHLGHGIFFFFLSDSNFI